MPRACPGDDCDCCYQNCLQPPAHSPAAASPPGRDPAGDRPSSRLGSPHDLTHRAVARSGTHDWTLFAPDSRCSIPRLLAAGLADAALRGNWDTPA